MNPLAVAPLSVSLLTTIAWMSSTSAVGPYISLIGTTSYSKPALTKARNDRTCSIRSASGSIRSLLDLFASNSSSKFCRCQR